MLAASGKKVILLSSVIQTGQFVLPAVPSRTPSLRLRALQFQFSLQWFGDCPTGSSMFLELWQSVEGVLCYWGSGKGGRPTHLWLSWVAGCSHPLRHIYSCLSGRQSCTLFMSPVLFTWAVMEGVPSRASFQSTGRESQCRAPTSDTTFICTVCTVLPPLHPQCIQPWPHLHSCLVSLQVALPAPGCFALDISPRPSSFLNSFSHGNRTSFYPDLFHAKTHRGVIEFAILPGSLRLLSLKK